VLDGGMVDNVPVGALDETPGRVLGMVTRLYPRPQMFVVPHQTAQGVQQRLYVQPSARVPISSWDYTSPQQMQHAYNLGRVDGERLLARLPEVMDAAAHA